MKAIKSIRFSHYDYAQDGYYFVTICTNYHRPYLSELGEKIGKSIQNLNGIEGVGVDYFVVMPTHIHLIIILSECKISLGEIVRRFKASSSREAGIKLWQPNYYEHVIRNEKASFKIREYIQNNPLKEKIDFERIYEP
ncbi:MAG: transposase [candidate division Zixibacteria bacterium]|nr:transposase [candidate division Zixibacteria bacterium]